jgi:hypothetical protein
MIYREIVGRAAFQAAMPVTRQNTLPLLAGHAERDIGAVLVAFRRRYDAARFLIVRLLMQSEVLDLQVADAISFKAEDEISPCKCREHSVAIHIVIGEEFGLYSPRAIMEATFPVGQCP